jgi:peptidoglycan/xylan/chitin deacetylase (PgdA/CDA1 family)
MTEMRIVAAAAVLIGLASSSSLAAVAEQGASCPGNPNAIGTSRTLVVDPTEHTRIGTMQYEETLPLEDHEVVLTFDDGPLPPNTSRVRDILAGECVKATYFMIGRMAHSYPDEVRKTFEAGHTIGTHSQNHPLSFQHMAPEKFQEEIDQGIANVAMALGDPTELAPFFRIPGLLRQSAVEDYLASKGIMTWSADFPADDWKHIKPEEIIKRALTRLEAKGRGVLLLHDIQRATVAALPTLLHELKARGYRIVHVVPATPDRPKTPTTPEQWLPAHHPQVALTPMATTVQLPISGDLPTTALTRSTTDMLFSPAPMLASEKAGFVAGRASPPIALSHLGNVGAFRIAGPAVTTKAAAGGLALSSRNTGSKRTGKAAKTKATRVSHARAKPAGKKRQHLSSR